MKAPNEIWIHNYENNPDVTIRTFYAPNTERTCPDDVRYIRADKANEECPCEEFICMGNDINQWSEEAIKKDELIIELVEMAGAMRKILYNYNSNNTQFFNDADELIAKAKEFLK